MAGKTTAERQRAFRERHRADGLVEVRGVFAKPEHHARIRAYAARVAKGKEMNEQSEPVARVDDLERGGRVRALILGLGLDAPLYTAPPAAQPSAPVVTDTMVDAAIKARRVAVSKGLPTRDAVRAALVAALSIGHPHD